MVRELIVALLFIPLAARDACADLPLKFDLTFASATVPAGLPLVVESLEIANLGEDNVSLSRLVNESSGLDIRTPGEAWQPLVQSFPHFESERLLWIWPRFFAQRTVVPAGKGREFTAGFYYFCHPLYDHNRQLLKPGRYEVQGHLGEVRTEIKSIRVTDAGEDSDASRRWRADRRFVDLFVGNQAFACQAGSGSSTVVKIMYSRPPAERTAATVVAMSSVMSMLDSVAGSAYESAIARFLYTFIQEARRGSLNGPLDSTCKPVLTALARRAERPQFGVAAPDPRPPEEIWFGREAQSVQLVFVDDQKASVASKVQLQMIAPPANTPPGFMDWLRARHLAAAAGGLAEKLAPIYQPYYVKDRERTFPLLPGASYRIEISPDSEDLAPTEREFTYDAERDKQEIQLVVSRKE